uniref:Uncharacterized protein n=1 Tax=Rhizophora mucronata TaxID=61149 RepID=A0A2P2QDL3_RHIMU
MVWQVHKVDLSQYFWCLT